MNDETTEQQRLAEQRADARNRELGAKRDSERFAIAVQRPDGQWVVEERREKRGIVGRLFDALP
jgi:hypothetical protein